MYIIHQTSKPKNKNRIKTSRESLDSTLSLVKLLTVSDLRFVHLLLNCFIASDRRGDKDT